MKCIGSPVVEIWPFAYLGGIWNPHFGEGEVVGGQRWWFPIGSPLWPLCYLTF